MGPYEIDRYVQYLKDICAHVLPSLDLPWQSTYHARMKAMRFREAYENEALLGFAKVTKTPGGQRKEIHALTLISGYGVNLIGEVSEKHPLSQGLNLKICYCDLTQGSAKVNLMIENTTNQNITIPAKAIVCQLNLASKNTNAHKPEGQESKSDDFSLDQADLGNKDICLTTDLCDKDIDLTFEKVRSHHILVEDLGEDQDEDFRDKTCHGKTNQEFVPNFTPKENEQRNTIESEDYKDSGE